MMDQGDVDDIFAEMTQGLGLEEAKESDYDYSDLDKVELLQKFNSVYKKLANRRALIEAHTPEDQDLQAEYHGLLKECQKRGIK